MLTHLTIRNLAITESLSIEFKSGMSAITGETGAGKSILMDGLGYVLGNRADSGLVRQGSERAEIIAEFDVKNIASARQWLESQDLSEGSECILRRTITREGRSRATINGQPVPLQQIKQLNRNTNVIMYSSQEQYGVAVQTIGKGALQYVIKDQSAFAKIKAIFFSSLLAIL